MIQFVILARNIPTQCVTVFDPHQLCPGQGKGGEQTFELDMQAVAGPTTPLDPATPFEHLRRIPLLQIPYLHNPLKVLIIRILVPNVTHEAPGGRIPSLEVLPGKSHQAVGNLLGNNLDVLLSNIPYAPVLDPILKKLGVLIMQIWVPVAYSTW